MSCQHIEDAADLAPQTTFDQGCQPCTADGSTDWVHLRRCLGCGLVACCDSSPQQHMSRHSAAAGHPVIASFEPGETWRWCVVDGVLAA